MATAFLVGQTLAFTTPRRKSICTKRYSIRASVAGVIGASGGSGRLIVDRLLEITRSSSSLTGVRALVRSLDTAKALPSQDPALEITQLPHPDDALHLQRAFEGLSYLVVCGGTTAFPSRAWAKGNTPTFADDISVANWMNALHQQSVRRIVYVSSVGTLRPNRFPFPILNLFGILDAKRKGELHVIDAAKRFSCSYAILRPGRLFGEPNSNVGNLTHSLDSSCMDVQIAKGDCLNGSVNRSVVADIAALAVTWDTPNDFDICFVNVKGSPPPAQKLVEKMKMCEMPSTANQFSA